MVQGRASFVSLCLASLLVAACDSPQETESPAPTGSSVAPYSLPALRADWKTRWATLPPLPDCKELAPTVAPACEEALKKRQELAQAEAKDIASEQHLTLAAEAARATAHAATQLELAYVQRLVLNAAPSDSAAPNGGAAPSDSAAPSGSAAPSAKLHPGHGDGKVAMPSGSAAPSGSAHHDHGKDGIKEIIQHAKHGEARDRDPVLSASAQYFGAERDSLLRLAGYIRAGSPAEREQALKLLEHHAERFPKSQRTRQVVAETSVIVSDEAVRARLESIRSKLGAR